ncbi:hypothetical protein LPJ61_000127 [Coemansia biformis]|uniref:Uncharacterized protein n=1 Tax=Coemansia biformis TaxID=1286918 RepID=A0A9W7YHA3_9FUNG|nr:hypothetical protein LPJ61_000127 [Coemansia biformis]
MAGEVFPMPVDCEFVLVQGRVARNSRLRRMSDVSMSSTLAPRTPGRRRNTVGTSHPYEHTSTQLSGPPTPLSPIQPTRALPGPGASPAFGIATARPPVPPLHIGLPAVPPLYSLPEEDDLSLGMSSCGSLLIDDLSVELSPLSPPPSPPAGKAEPWQAKGFAASLPTLLAAIPEHTGIATPASPTCEEPPVTAPAHGRASDDHEDAVTCFFLDNKKICLARPRLVHITPLSPFPTAASPSHLDCATPPRV